MEKEKIKLSIEDQIKHMKDCGIVFQINSEEEASKYLANNTYYFKLKVYAKLFQKNCENKYVKLDFALLRNLAVIDSYFRKEIMNLSLDIEHYLKVNLLRDFNDSNEDGYQIISEYFRLYPNIESSINTIGKDAICNNLIKKYDGHFAIWNVIEVLSFKNFTNLYRLFYLRKLNVDTTIIPDKDSLKSYSNKKIPYYSMLYSVRMLRNAAAHNNPLLFTLGESDREVSSPSYILSSFLGNQKISNKRITHQLRKVLIHDFSCVLYIYYKVAPRDTSLRTFNRIKNMLQSRQFLLYKDYYIGNSVIEPSYLFVLEEVNIYIRLLQNKT